MIVKRKLEEMTIGHELIEDHVVPVFVAKDGKSFTPLNQTLRILFGSHGVGRARGYNVAAKKATDNDTLYVFDTTKISGARGHVTRATSKLYCVPVKWLRRTVRTIMRTRTVKTPPTAKIISKPAPAPKCPATVTPLPSQSKMYAEILNKKVDDGVEFDDAVAFVGSLKDLANQPPDMRVLIAKTLAA